MATLIQSKQIQGIVSASVIHGEFLVSGSLTVTGSNSILGSVTASAISSSFLGDGSGITGITYSQIDNTPQFIGGNNVTITSSSNVITVHATLDGTGSDAQNLSISGDQLTILGGNTITIPTGSGVSDYTQLTNVPSGLVSGSIQILGGSGILSGSKTDISSLNTFSASIQSEVDLLTAATSSYITELPSGVISGSSQLPAGVISGSTQITITESQISDLDKYTDSDVKSKLDAEGVVSGSYVESLPQGVISGSEQLPSGIISGSTQITITESQISDLSHTDISNLNTFTSSIQSEVDSLTSATSSYLTEVPAGTVSGSAQIIDSLPSGTVSGSSQISIESSQITDLAHTQIPSGTISGSEQLPSGLVSSSLQVTITESQISDLDKYTDSDVQTYIDSLGVVSGSVVAELPSGVISGSEQLPSGVISGSAQVIDLLPDGVVSGSSQITISESQISDLDKYTDSDVKTKLDAEGVVSGSYVQSLPSGTVSGSSQITITESQISDLDKYTDSDVKTKLDTEGVLSGSLISQLPSGVISGSEQLPSGVISGSSQISITESQISDLVHYTDSDVKTKLDTEGVLSGSLISQLPSGVVSGSVQITDGSGIVSSSSQIIQHLPDGVISGSTYTDFSSSVSESIDELQIFSSSAYQLDSASLDRRLDGLEGGAALYYDLSNTVINNNYIKSGSGEISDTSNFLTGNKPFKLKLNKAAKLAYEVGDIVYITNFDRDTVIHALVSSSYETGSLTTGFTVLDVNGSTDSTRINDSYWVVTKQSGGFITSASYGIDSASFDYRIDGIVASGSGADWNVNLYNIPQGIVSGSNQLTGSFASTSSLDIVSASLATTIENVFQSSSNFDNKTLVSGSSQIDIRNTTNYVADEHIDHTTVVITAGDGLDGGGNIASSREITLNVTSSHFEDGVKDVLTAEGVVKTTTLNTDLVSTDFSQSVDSRIRGVAAGAVPSGTVSGSTQIDISQTQNYTAFSSSIATSIDGVSASPTDIGLLNTFTSSIQAEVDALIAATSSYLTSETDSQTLSIDGDQLTISTGNTVTIPTGSDVDISALNTFTSSADTRITNLESFSSSLDTDFATDVELSNLSSSLSASIYNAGQSGSGVSSWNELSDIPSGIVSGSLVSQLPTGILSGSEQIASDISGSFTSVSESLDTRITTEKDRIDNILSGANADYDQFVEIVNLVNTTDTENDTAFANHYTSSRERLTSLEAFSSSLDTNYATDTEVTNLSSSLSQSIYEAGQSGSGVSSWNELTDIPSGIISGSSQLTSSYDTRYLTSASYFIDSASFDTRIDGIAAGNVPSGTVSSSAQITYDGDRTISNDKLGDLFTDSVNPGTSGSVIDFLNAVFYPNTGPSISTGNQTIIEYVTSGTTITTLSGTDPEGQAITFGTSSLYTDDLVRVASNGVMTLNALAESSSFNTDLVGGSHGHKVEVTATDTFGTTTEKDIYIFVTPNSTPVFRETSTSGNVITSVTANLNESSTNDTLVKRVYFTDANGDNITIHSSSIDNNHFDVTKYSTYVDIRQNTSSLDYEQQTTYTFSISASDEHYEAGQDSDSIVGLPITVNVTDNLTPTVNNQTLSSINENSSNGATVGSISAADNEGNTITFVNFDLHQLELDGSIVTSGSYSGTSQLTDPHENPFQMSTSGVVTRKTGVYLNSDLINRYVYRAQVTDAYNGTSDVALITINITDDTPATITDNWSAGPYIKESELSSTTIKTTDYGSTAADYGVNQSGTWSSSNSAISINSNGTLSLGVDLSGSVTQSGDTIDSTITFTNTFGTTTTDSLTVNVVGNDAPTATFTNQTSIFDSNQATSGTNLVSVSISDTESDSPYQLTIGGTHAAKLNAVPQNVASSSWELQASEDLIGGTYTYDVTITDSYSETTTYSSRTITIAQGDTGTLGGDTTSYIIESAESGDVLRDVTGYNQGNASQLSVSYTDYGSPVVQSYTSSNEAFNIDTSGNITLGLDLSGSVTQSGDTITSDITFTDQYGNIGSGSLSVSVFANNPASATFTENSSFFNTNQATGSTSLVDITSISDTESNTPYVVTLTGTHASSFNVVSQNVNGTSWELQPSSDLSAGDYDYNVVITDNYSEVTTYSRSLTIAQADDGTLGGDTSIYIIESAENTDVFRDQTGYNNGNAAQVSVSYSPSYGSPTVTEFTSSRQGISVDSSGNLTAGYDFSGSVTSTDYTSTALASGSTNSTLYDKSLHVNGIKVVQGAATASQSAVPDAFTEKVAQTIKLMVTSSGADINDTDQANMIGILKGETGTWHSGYPTAQRILRGAGSDYSPNPLDDSNYSSYPGLQNFQDSHATDDMIWYLNSSAASGSGDADIVEVIEHLMHTIHQYGVRGAVSGSFNGLSWDPETDSDWNTRELYLAIKEAVDDSVFDISSYGDASYNTAATFKLIAKEYLYLLNFNMWEYSSLWSGGSLSPEWNDNSRTPSGIQTNNPLGYALYNKYIKPVLTKPSKTVLENIFQDGDVGDPTVAGSSGYTPEVGTGLISEITFRDQYDNIGSGSVTATVFDNSAPTADFSNSGLTGNYNTNLATSGTALLTSTITDTEGDTPYSMSLSGTGAWAIEAVPQNSNSSSYEIQVTYDTSSLVAGTYTYDVEVTDNFGKSRTYSDRTFTIAAADTGTLVSTDTYIIESAVSGDYIRRNANGRSGTQSSVAVSYSPSYGSPVATNFASSNALIDIDSAGRLSVGNDISGSGSTNGSIIATTITWNDQYSNNGSQVISIDVTENFAPTVSSTSTSNLNTNQATGSELILRLNLTDTESDTINASGLTWTGYDSTYFQPSNTTGQMNLLVNNTSVPAGEYDYTASMEDVHGFTANLVSGSYTIAQADNGTLGGDTAIYSIESAESGESYRDATGYNNGNTAQVSVSYSPSYGSPSVQSFTSSNPAIAIDGSGNLTLGVDISGSVTQSGDTISSTITFTDQYGNSDTGTVTATIFGNQSPAASFTSASAYDSDASISGSTAGTLTVTDTENNSPFTFTLAGTDGDKFNVAGSSSPFTIQPTGSLAAGSYSINITITDNYSESVTLTNETIVVDAAEVLSNIYVYTLPIDGTYNNVSGISANGSGTPPSPTIATTYGFFTAFVDSDTLGDSTITVAYGSNFTATKRATVSGSNVDTALDGVGMSIGSSERVYIFIPSGSDTLGGVPTSLTTSDPGSSTTTGEYVLFVANEDSYQGSSGGLSNDIKTANIHKLTLDTAVDGYTDWFVVGTNDRYNAGNSTLYLRLAPSSGSVPS